MEKNPAQSYLNQYGKVCFLIRAEGTTIPSEKAVSFRVRTTIAKGYVAFLFWEWGYGAIGSALPWHGRG